MREETTLRGNSIFTNIPASEFAKKSDTYSADFVITAYLEGVEQGKKARIEESKSILKKNTEIALNQIETFDRILSNSYSIESKKIFVQILGMDLFEVIIISKNLISYKYKLEIASLKKQFGKIITNFSNIRVNINVFDNIENLNLKMITDEGYYMLK